jgi:hypothetical protein
VEEHRAVCVAAIHPVPDRRQLAKLQVVGDQGGLARAARAGYPDQGPLQTLIEPGVEPLTGVDLIKHRAACLEGRKIGHAKVLINML